MLKLGSFTWPNDPERLTVSYSRKLKSQIEENGLWSVENQGRFGRSFVGEGVFYGKEAYDTFSRLAQLLYDGNPLTFEHPMWDEATVLLTDLTVTEEWEDDLLHYRFEMTELPPTV